MTERATKENWLLARPEVELDLIRQVARDAFAVSGELKELGSQQDRNFMVIPESGTGVLLKVNHPAVSASALSLQGAVSDRLRAKGISTPKLLRTADGGRSVAVHGIKGSVSRACAFELIDGQSLAEVAGMDGARAEDLGALAARTVNALAGLEHVGANREIQWELTRALEVVEWLLDGLPAERQDACLEAATEAAQRVSALGERLPRQIIHGDLTSDNIMLDNEGACWVVDLGDTAQSWRVADLAVLLADMLGRTGDLAVVGRAVRGYADEASLTDDEIEAIWPLVVLRGAVLAVSGWSQLRIDPDNTYARERIEHEWQVFQQAVRYDYGEVTAQLRLAAGRPHLRDETYAPIVPLIGQALVVDLGIRSPLLDRGRWADAGIETELARDALMSAPVAAMRFGESRLTRVSPDVAAPTATKARFTELWTRPGTGVRAPFSARIVVADGSIELTDKGVVLRIEEVELAERLCDHVERGDVLGRVTATGYLRVSRRMLNADPDPAFGASGEEYETLGAANPSVIIGVAAAADPLVELRRERRRRDRAMGGAAERYYANPPQIERGWNTLLIDTEGRSYLDMVNNVTAIGHSHPRLADAVSRQLHLLNTNSRFLYEAYADFADKLLEYSPDPSLDTVIPVNSGSEAIDLAIRLAQVATGRKDVIAAREGYHGWTMAADSVSTSAFDNPSALASRPDWVHLVDAPNSYRGPFRGPGSGADYAREVFELAQGLNGTDHAPAAFICEPVLGNAGGVVPPEGFLAAAYKAIRVHGGLAIADEVQVGYGRLGKAFWGSTMQGATPDIIAVAKAAGNGFPLGAVITRREIVDALRRDGMFFSSAAGAPASAIAGSAVLDVIREERLQENADRVGGHLLGKLRELAQKHPLIGQVHGSGLYLGIELVKDHETLKPATEETAWLCEHLLHHGVIIQATSERQNVLKVKPPMTLSLADANVFLHAVDTGLTALTTKR